jgi:hypothetical protein
LYFSEEQKTATTIAMEELSVRRIEAELIHSQQKHRTHALFSKHNKPLPPPGNLADSANKVRVALAEKRRLQADYNMSQKTMKAPHLTGISATPTHGCYIIRKQQE